MNRGDRRRTAWTQAAVVLLLVGACAGEAPTDGFMPDSLYLLPSDLTTGVPADAPFGIGVNVMGLLDEVPSDAAAFEALSLVSWPAETVVSGEVLARAFVPDGPLARGWYALRFDDRDLPPHFRFGTQGVHTARFHVGSLPLLRASVRLVEGTMSFTLELRATEEVRTDDVEPLVRVRFGEVDANCHLARPELAGQRQFLENGIDFVCAERVGGVPMTLTVARGIVSRTDGTPLRDFEGRTEISITWAPFGAEGELVAVVPLEEPTPALFAVDGTGP